MTPAATAFGWPAAACRRGRTDIHTSLDVAPATTGPVVAPNRRRGRWTLRYGDGGDRIPRGVDDHPSGPIGLRGQYIERSSVDTSDVRRELDAVRNLLDPPMRHREVDITDDAQQAKPAPARVR